jgi:hypothetical protein
MPSAQIGVEFLKEPYSGWEPELQLVYIKLLIILCNSKAKTLITISDPQIANALSVSLPEWQRMCSELVAKGCIIVSKGGYKICVLHGDEKVRKAAWTQEQKDEMVSKWNEGCRPNLLSISSITPERERKLDWNLEKSGSSREELLTLMPRLMRLLNNQSWIKDSVRKEGSPQWGLDNVFTNGKLTSYLEQLRAKPEAVSGSSIPMPVLREILDSCMDAEVNDAGILTVEGNFKNIDLEAALKELKKQSVFTNKFPSITAIIQQNKKV